MFRAPSWCAESAYLSAQKASAYVYATPMDNPPDPPPTAPGHPPLHREGAARLFYRRRHPKGPPLCKGGKPRRGRGGCAGHHLIEGQTAYLDGQKESSSVYATPYNNPSVSSSRTLLSSGRAKAQPSPAPSLLLSPQSLATLRGPRFCYPKGPPLCASSRTALSSGRAEAQPSPAPSLLLSPAETLRWFPPGAPFFGGLFRAPSWCAAGIYLNGQKHPPHSAAR